MKTWCLALVFWLVAQAQLPAQVTVEVVLDQEQFLPSESLPVAVRITNRSGQTLHLGDTDAWLAFAVEAREGFVVLKSGEVPVKGEFVLESSQVATKRVDLAPCYNLTRPGRYNLAATVHVKEWDREFVSKTKSFDVIPGTKLWEQEFGVPISGGATNANPEVRKYILLQANYLKQLKLYVRVTDEAESRVFKVFPLHSMVSFSQPEPQVDKSSNLHVLCQTGPRPFTYTVINPDGVILLRQTHDYAGARPRLKTDAEGHIVVVGGARRVTREDIPAPGP